MTMVDEMEVEIQKELKIQKLKETKYRMQDMKYSGKVEKFYTKDQVIEASTKWFNGDSLAADAFTRKYALQRHKNEFAELTPDDMCDRTALALVANEKDKEKWYAIFREQIDGFKKIVLQGSPMAALGNKYHRMTLSNCYVIPLKNDTLKDVIQAGYEMAQIQAFRGGVGIDVSTLRPAGSPVSNAASSSTGAYSWCDFYSFLTRMVGQQGRQGALMLSIDVSHPDIENFIAMKSDMKKVTGANVSVKLTDAFMRAVVDNTDFDLKFEFKDGKYPDIIQTVKARDLWNKIIHYATTTAEPGLLMWDNILRRSPADCYADLGFKTISTNPCAEIPLSAYDSCRLTSLNLTGFVKNSFTKDASFDFDAFKDSIAVGVRMLDNMVDLDSEHPFKEQTEAAQHGRRLGLGTHGLGDMLARIGLRYDSEEAINFVDNLYKFFKVSAYRASVELAKERGPFPIWDPTREQGHEYLEELPEDLKTEMAIYGRRNIAMLTCAPTGTVSLMSRTSSGIEPIYALSYKRRVKMYSNEDKANTNKDGMGDSWRVFNVFHPAFEEYMKQNGISENQFDESSLPDYWVTADKINWEKRVRMQAVITKHLDHASSSTINLPRGTSEEVVGNIYLQAWRLGLKGVTVYVDGCRDGVLIREDDRSPKIERPKELDAIVHSIKSAGGVYTVIVGFMNGKIYEVFCVSGAIAAVTDGTKGKIVKAASKSYNFVGGKFEDGEWTTVVNRINKHEDSEAAAFTRLLSTSLRYGVPLEEITEQLLRANGTINSMAKAINRVICKYAKPVTGIECPECGGTNTRLEEACMKCLDCSYSRCG